MVTLEALSFVDKIWPLLEKRMESRVEEKLSSITTAAFDCIKKKNAKIAARLIPTTYDGLIYQYKPLET